jgi:tRNA-dihydrouridine synthase B
MKIGNININNPVILAPMSGVTDYPFRQVVKSFGSSLLVSEMIASRAMIIQTRDSLKKCTISKEDGVVNSVQIAGCDPDVMGEAARLNEELGADVIDINFGCPVKKVVNGYAGSALMKDEPLATKILEAVVKSVKIPVTLKMRMGWDELNKNAPKLAAIAENVGIKMITIHGRTRAQMYHGHADWKFIKEVKKSVTIPVIANGDIKNFADVDLCLEESGADGVMIGRGAYGKPWIINQIMKYLETGKMIDEPSIKEQYNVLKSHYQQMIDFYGERLAISLGRKHIGWYSSGFHQSAEFRKKINSLDNCDDVLNEVTNFYHNLI